LLLCFKKIKKKTTPVFAGTQGNKTMSASSLLAGTNYSTCWRHMPSPFAWQCAAACCMQVLAEKVAVSLVPEGHDHTLMPEPACSIIKER
jgi:hypothetical protein